MEIIVTKNNGNHPFDVGRHIEVWGCVWVDEETGEVVTPDGTIPPGSWVELKPNPLDTINELLNLELSPTTRGHEVKGVCPSPDGLPGRAGLYLAGGECLLLAAAFERIGRSLKP